MRDRPWFTSPRIASDTTPFGPQFFCRLPQRLFPTFHPIAGERSGVTAPPSESAPPRFPAAPNQPAQWTYLPLQRQPQEIAIKRPEPSVAAVVCEQRRVKVRIPRASLEIILFLPVTSRRTSSRRTWRVRQGHTLGCCRHRNGPEHAPIKSSPSIAAGKPRTLFHDRFVGFSTREISRALLHSRTLPLVFTNLSAGR